MVMMAQPNQAAGDSAAQQPGLVVQQLAGAGDSAASGAAELVAVQEQPQSWWQMID